MSLNYKVMGEGPALVIMHGLFGSLDNWSTLAKQLAQNYQIWLLDLPNHGRSAHTDQFDYPGMAEAVMAFLEVQAIEQPVILGHSMGGKVAMHLLYEDEQYFAGAIIVDIAPKAYPVHHDAIIKALEAVPVSAIKSRGEAETALASQIEQQDVRLFLMKNLTRGDGGGYQWKMNLPLISREIDQVGTPMPEGAQIELHALFVRGAKSDYILDEDEADIARRFAHYELETVANAGHWVHAEQPEALLQLVTNYMKAR